ncbi:MAG: sulfatase [Planctomycetota bacterium]|nr:MAG: sulfatase [Planctomycetota bacterium]
MHSLTSALVCLLLFASANVFAEDALRPNILWLVSEDHGPHMGCYGDAYATTPNVDALAAKGLLYTHCWSNAPVCAPARTTLIAGMYAPSTGGQHMRSMVPYPRGKKMYPQFLREAGYYCTNNAKEDYNVEKPGKVWDDSSRKGHWKNRGEGQPFFAIFNSGRSHESQIRKRPHKAVHDPAQAPVPAYHPDTKEVRRDWAQYYDVVSLADADAGARLRELEEAGLTNDTIVFYYADHGSGMPRNKRWPCNAGLHVPLVVYIPEKFKHLRSEDYVAGGKTDRLVSFVDFAPTLLSLVGIRPPEWMQGHAFLGEHAAEPQPYLYGFRGRMDERIDMVRSVTDGRYVYVRNYMPHRIYGQHLNYMWQTPTTPVWERLHQQGKLTPEQDFFWNPKPAEELYDLENDPDEVHNLADSLEHHDVLERLRKAQRDLALKIRDVGFLPEGEMHARSQGTTPYDMARDTGKYPLERIMATAELASNLEPEATSALVKAFEDGDSAVRYWAAMGLLMRGKDAVAVGHGSLVSALADPSPYVRIVAAEALGRYGQPSDRALAIKVLADHADWSDHDVFTAMSALNALDEFPDDVAAIKSKLSGKNGDAPHGRYEKYVPRLVGDRDN